jgi:hypothetical protein
MFVALKNFYTCYGQKSLFLLLPARLWAISRNKYKVLANWAAWFTTGLFCFGYLQDSGAKDPHLSLASGDAGSRGLQGNDRGRPLFRPQKGWGDIRGGYTTQGLTNHLSRRPVGV